MRKGLGLTKDQITVTLVFWLQMIILLKMVGPYLPPLMNSMWVFFYSVQISNSRSFSNCVNGSDITIGAVVLMWPNTAAIKADTRICLLYNTEESSCLILSTVLTQHEDSPNSVLLLSVHVIHNVSLCKSIKGCCQHEHQEIALMIDTSFLSLECTSLLLTAVISRTPTCGKPRIQSQRSVYCGLLRYSWRWKMTSFKGSMFTQAVTKGQCEHSFSDGFWEMRSDSEQSRGWWRDVSEWRKFSRVQHNANAVTRCTDQLKARCVHLIFLHCKTCCHFSLCQNWKNPRQADSQCVPVYFLKHQ